MCEFVVVKVQPVAMILTGLYHSIARRWGLTTQLSCVIQPAITFLKMANCYVCIESSDEEHPSIN